MPIFLEAYISSLVDLYSESIPGVIQVIIKFDKRCFLFDGISTKDTRCSDLFPLLQERLGFKIPGHARLMENGRILRMGETLEQVRQGMTAETKVLSSILLLTILCTGRFNGQLHAGSYPLQSCRY
jgi:hypothetical protein